MKEKEIIWRTYGVTDITPLSVTILLVAGILILLLPRRYVVPVMLWPTFFISEFQRIVIADMDFNVMKILVIVGWLRLIIRGELQRLKLNAIDITFIGWALSGLFIYTLLWKTSSAFVFRAGGVFTFFGLYFLFGYLIKDLEDLRCILKWLVVVCIVMAVTMTVEKITMRNPLAMMGAQEIPAIRDERVRCQAAFAHPILAGTFGASLIPLFVSLWWQKERMQFVAIVGVVAAIIITIDSASSGPAMTVVAAIIGLCMWPWRRQMQIIRWGIFLGLMALHIFMKASVWFLIARIDVAGGSTAYYRALLIDRAIAHINEWWLLGTKFTWHWGRGLEDITNQYIRIGIDGGITTLILFVLIIVFCFQHLGRLQPLLENHSIAANRIFWAMGASLFAHAVSFMGVSYFDQIIFWWILLLAAISILGDFYGKRLGFNKVSTAGGLIAMVSESSTRLTQEKHL